MLTPSGVPKLIVKDSTDTMNSGYGFGVKISEINGYTVASHTGGQAGTAMVLLTLRDEQVYVAIMTNLTKSHYSGKSLYELAFEIAEIILEP